MAKMYSTTPQSKNLIEVLWKLQKIILNTLDFNSVAQNITNSLLTELGYLDLGYRIIVLTLVDPKKNVLRRIALSQTPEAKRALEASAVPFHQIDIPLNTHSNLLIKVLKEQKPLVTHHWPEIFKPILTEEEAVKNQTAAGIKTSMLFPVIVKDKSIGVLIFSMVKSESEVSQEEKDLISGFTDIVGLAVQNAKLYTSLGDASAKLKQANLKLKQLDTLKDEFVSVASHELRTPMTAIKSYLWMALNGKGGDLNDKQTYYLDRAYISTDRLIKLVNDMLNVSRIEAGRVSLTLEKVNVNILAEEVIAEVKPRADELGLKIKLKKDPKLPEVIADIDKIKEVMINFLGNSLKFTPRGGVMEIYFDIKDGMLYTHVKDNGKGIAIEDQEKLFQKFGLLKGSYTTNQTSSQGTGLGLYICKSIIELHKGEISAFSEGRDKGSIFTYSLKIYTPKDYKTLKAEQDGKDGKEIIHTSV